MVPARLLGMVVLGGLAELVFALSGSRLSDQPGGTQVMLMGFNMTRPGGPLDCHRGDGASLSARRAPRIRRST
jgi:hypothetical protein